MSLPKAHLCGNSLVESNYTCLTWPQWPHAPPTLSVLGLILVSLRLCVLMMQVLGQNFGLEFKVEGQLEMSIDRNGKETYRPVGLSMLGSAAAIASRDGNDFSVVLIVIRSNFLVWREHMRFCTAT